MRRRFGLILVAVWLPIAGLSAGCARSGVIDAALDGDLATLKREVASAQEKGQLEREDVEKLAEAVAGREVRSTEGEPAIDRINRARACVRPLARVLRDRAKKSDDAAAAAALVLADAGMLDRAAALEQHADSLSGPWRAVAARVSSTPEDAARRRPLFADPDERVRRAALQAAVEARDPGDLEALLEAARLDPDPLNRSVATRAVGAVGGERAVLGLKDQWARADQTTKVTIVAAWGMPAAWKTGGERELLWAAERTKNLPALAAAEELMRHGAPSAEVGVALLARGIRDGTFAERSVAARVAPLDGPGVLEALEKAAKDKEQDVQVIALARLLDDNGHHQSSIAELRKIAKSEGDRARRARAALAAAGDSSVRPYLVKYLASKSPGERKMGAVGLLRLGDYAKAASVLADTNPRIRMEVACTVLARRPSRR